MKKSLANTYFAMTSLSTVGLGDIRPTNDYDRISASIILLFGVMIFSLIMGIFNEIVDSIRLLNKTFNDSDNLCRFFGLIKNFNSNNEMDLN
jgi:hypothetical protein